ncbi:MAG: patatin-like phospholipase family protein [Woeseiaceae bacterium]|nr:patatin-like phospholipase family protein [Woeseiaceae bacterium]
MSQDKKTVSLVLGSGGARGHAHIGVIRALNEKGFEVRNISGCSMGSVIGGIFAADELDTYTEWAFQLTRGDVVKLLDFSFSLRSIFKGERIFDVLKELVGDCKIEDLDKSFTAVATSLEDEEEIWLNSGSLFTAMRSSTAVPGVFSPVQLNGHTLVDGGLINPLPIAPTLNDPTDFTIAVNLAGIDQDYTPPETTEKDADERNSYRERIAEYLSGLKDDDAPGSGGSDFDAADLIVKSIDIMQGAIARFKLAAYAPDKTIDIPRNACSFFEFHRAEEMADLGYEKARKVLEHLNA